MNSKSVSVSYALLSIDKAFQDEIVTESGIKFYLDGSYNKEWCVAATATIEQLPTNPDPKYKKIASQLSVGDEVAINYQVVYDLTFGDDGKQFMPTTEGDDRMRFFINGYGEKLDVVALPGKIAPIWVGCYRNKIGDLVDGAQGTQSDVERWLSQFPIGKTDRYTFNNLFEYDKKDYWKCELNQIYAVRRKGHLIALGEKVICLPVEEKVPVFYIPNAIQNKDVKVRYTDRGRVLSGGKDIGLKKDMIVAFNPSSLERYDFFGKQYYIINQNRILGKWDK